MAKAYLVTTGEYSDYTVLAVALTETEAQQWADAYNAERASVYRDDASVEEVNLIQPGSPMPKSVTLWSADERSEWSYTQITADPATEFAPTTGIYGGYRGRIVTNFPSREAARAAWDAEAQQ